MDIIVINGEEIDVIGKKLDLLAAYTKINDKDVQVIINLLKFRENITALDLSHNHLGERQWNSIEEIISSGSSLTSLYLSHNALELAEHWHSISNAIIKLQYLTELDISNNSITTAGMRHLTTALQNNFSLKKLSMQYIKMSEEIIAEFAQLMRYNQNIDYLDLFGCSLNGYMSSLPLVQALAKNRTITYLDLGSQKAFSTTENRTELYEVLGSISSLRTLKLESHTMHDHEVEALIYSLLQSRASITSLDLTQNAIEMKKSRAITTLIDTCHSLTELIIGENKITQRGLEMLEAAINKSDKITCFTMPIFNHISDSSFALFKENKSITELDLTGYFFNNIPVIAKTNFVGLKNIKKLNLEMCSLKEDAELVVNALINSPIEDLNLESNYINYRGEAIPDLLRRTKTLKKLNLARNMLDDEFGPILEALSVNNTITELNICGNFLRRDGSKTLQKSLAVNTTMKTLIAASTSFDINSVKDLIATNRSLTMLDVRFNDHKSSDYDLILPALRSNVILTEIYWMYRYLDVNRGSTVVRLFPSMMNEGERILFENKRRKIFASKVFMIAQTILLSGDPSLFAAVPLEVLYRILSFCTCRYFSKKQIGIIYSLVNRSSLHVDLEKLCRALK
jgi:Ran GTPase-activating protein (RanGAP) involved in mRNA processing and transport